MARGESPGHDFFWRPVFPALHSRHVSATSDALAPSIWVTPRWPRDFVSWHTSRRHQWFSGYRTSIVITHC